MSGLVAIYAVFQISKFLNSQPKNRQVEVEALVSHTVAFGLFMIGVVITQAFYIKSLLKQTGSFSKPYLISGICYTILSFIAQCFLVQIFWKLSKKVPA